MATQMTSIHTRLPAWSVSQEHGLSAEPVAQAACPCQAVCHGSCEIVLINTPGHAKSCRMTADVPGLEGVPVQ